MDPKDKKIEELTGKLETAEAANEELTGKLETASKGEGEKEPKVKHVEFSATLDGKKRKFRVVSPKVEVPGRGVFNTIDLVKDKANAEVLATLLAKGSGVFKEV